jgi:hypothetical protein
VLARAGATARISRVKCSERPIPRRRDHPGTAPECRGPTILDRRFDGVRDRTLEVVVRSRTRGGKRAYNGSSRAFSLYWVPQEQREPVDGVGVTDDFVAGLLGPDKREAIRVERGGDDARSAAADLDPDGSVRDRIVGRASSKADVERRAATRFVEYLKRDGAQWHAPVVVGANARDEAGVDCRAENDAGEVLKMQVTSAEREAWRCLDHALEIERQCDDIEPVVDALRDAVAAKRLDGRGEITLLIDATDSPRASMRGVVEEFRRRYGLWAREQGWQAIWLVGPVVEFVSRLDIE